MLEIRDGLIAVIPLILPHGIHGGCLPFGEVRGGDFALSEIPHPFRVLFPIANIGINSLYTSTYFALITISQFLQSKWRARRRPLLRRKRPSRRSLAAARAA